MKHGNPWSVKGIDLDARDAAKDAARRAGMTLGEWLNHVIAENAREEERQARRYRRPVLVEDDEDDDDGDPRLAAVTDRIARLSRQSETAIPRGRMGRESFPSDPVRAQTAAVERRTADALDAMLRLVERSEEQRRETVSSLAKAQERTSNAVRDAMELVSSRLDSLERSLAGERAPSVQPVRETLARLEERVSSMTRQPQGDRTAQSPVEPLLRGLESRLADIADRISDAEGRGPRDSGERIDRIEEKLGSILDMLSEPDEQPPVRIDAQPGSLDEAIQQIRARQRQIEKPRRAAAAPRADSRTTDLLDGLRTDMASLARRLEGLAEPRVMPAIQELKQELAETHALLEQVAPREDIRALEGTLRELAERIAVSRDVGAGDGIVAPMERLAGDVARLTDELRPTGALGGIRESLAKLEARIDRMPAQGARPDALAALQKQIHELRGTIESTAQPALLDEIRHHISSVAYRFDQLVGAPSHAGEASFGREVQELRSAIQSIDPSSTLQSLERRITDLAAQVAQSQKAAPGSEDMRRDIAAVARSVEKLAPREDIQALERTVRDLAARVETSRDDGTRETLVGPLERLTKDVARLMEELRPNGALGGLRQDIASLAMRMESMPAASLQSDGAAALSDQLSELRTQTEDWSRYQPLDGIRAQIADLTDRFDRMAARPERGDALSDAAFSREVASLRQAIEEASPRRALDQLERRIDAVAERLDRLADEPAPRHTDVGGLETLVRQLAEKLDAVREPSGDPAGALEALERQVAAMTGVLERSDEGLNSLRAMERSIETLFAKIDEAKHSTMQAAELAARRAVQDRTAPSSDIDTRTRETLSAMHEALEKIVDRLGALESEVAPDRSRTGPVDPSASAAQRIAAASAAAEAAKALSNRPEARRPAPPPRGTPVDPKALTAMARASATKAMRDVADAEQRLAGQDDILLEPGSGRPDPSFEPAPAEPVEREPAPANFIAAARKAAQAANPAAAQEPAKKGLSLQALLNRGKEKAAPAAKPEAAASAPAAQKAAPAASIRAATEAAAGAAKGSPLDTVRSFIDQRRRPILIGIAAIVLALGTMQMLRDFIDPPPPPRIEAPAPRVAPAPAPAPAAATDTAPAPKVEPVPSAPAPSQGAAPPSAVPTPATAGKPSAMLAPMPDSGARPLGAGLPPTAGFVAPGNDPASVGSIPRQPAASAATTAPSEATPATPLPSLDLPPGQWPKGLQKALGTSSAAASYEVASRLTDGRGTQRDTKVAARWFERAAQQGLAPAQYRLGSIYEKGIGVTRDLPTAKGWYEKAAAAGNAKAMHNLGVLIAEGGLGKPDYAAAAEWFRKAAEYGVRDSQYNLAILSARGLGVEQKLSESYFWFAIAAAQGDEDAGKKREEVASRLDAATLAATKARVDAFKPRPLNPAANDVLPPPGGWDAEPAKSKQVRL